MYKIKLKNEKFNIQDVRKEAQARALSYIRLSNQIKKLFEEKNYDELMEKFETFISLQIFENADYSIELIHKPYLEYFYLAESFFEKKNYKKASKYYFLSQKNNPESDPASIEIHEKSNEKIIRSYEIIQSSDLLELLSTETEDDQTTWDTTDHDLLGS